MKEPQRAAKYIVIAIVSLAALLATIYFYVDQFGQNGLSNKTQDWANFGAYFGGVLSPVVTSITLIFLYLQIKSSKASTKTQIEEAQASTEAQIKHMQDTREIEIITNEINHISSFTFNMMTEIRKIPDENFKIFISKEFKRWDHDYSNKQVVFTKFDGEIATVPWADVLLYLKSIFEHYNDDDVAEILAEYPYKHIYESIASLLGHLVLHCYKLARIDKSSYDLIRTKLSLFSAAIHYLNKAKFVDDDLVDDVYLLQSLALPLKRNDLVDLRNVFSNEINNQNIFEVKVNADDVKVRSFVKNKGVNGQITKYSVECKGRELERTLGTWQ